MTQLNTKKDNMTNLCSSVINRFIEIRNSVNREDTNAGRIRHCLKTRVPTSEVEVSKSDGGLLNKIHM